MKNIFQRIQTSGVPPKQVNKYSRHSTLMSSYKNIEDVRFRHYI
ncbi:hypothetical protein [Alkalihalobacillus trypoxylicola]|nr:hypothetical protein [Alkalihalobacillus trypoxylicola]